MKTKKVEELKPKTEELKPKYEYFFDNLYYNDSLGEYESLLKPLNDLASFYEGLGLTERFSVEIMTSAINNTPMMQNKLKTELTAALELLSLPKMFRDNLEKEIIHKVNQLGERVQAFKHIKNSSRAFARFSVNIDFELYKVADGKVVFDEGSKSKLRECCTVFVTNATQQKAIDIVTEINTKIQQLYKFLSNRMSGIPEDNKTILNTCTESNNGLIKLTPVIIESLK